MRDTFARSVYQLARKDPRVFVVVADISPAGSMAQFRAEFPQRFIDVGVAEASMIGICAGLALRGCRPFAYTIANFSIYRPFEMVRNDLCYQNIPVTVVGIGGGVTYSQLGGTHHTQEDIGVMSSLPNMAILAPCDPMETEAAVTACAMRTGPTYLRLGKSGEPNLTSKAVEPFQFGKLRMLRQGADLCILSYGPVMRLAFELAAEIETGGRSVTIMNAHTLKPLDVESVSRCLRGHPEVVVIEEHSERGGLAAHVKQIAWDCGAKCRLHTFSLRDEFIHFYGSHPELIGAHGLSLQAIGAALGLRPGESR